MLDEELEELEEDKDEVGTFEEEPDEVLVPPVFPHPARTPPTSKADNVRAMIFLFFIFFLAFLPCPIRSQNLYDQEISQRRNEEMF